MKVDEKLALGRHSLAHVLAKAVCELYDNVQLGIGPAIDNGFYYDFLMPDTIRESDFNKIETKMKEIIDNNEDFTVWNVDTPDECFKNQPLKLELIKEFQERGENLTAYNTGDDFYDLCIGPHVSNTKELRNWGFAISSVAGAFWRGDNSRPMLQRVYCYAFDSRKALKEYYKFLEEAAKRDHRMLGNKLDLFFFDETAPGMPYWLPKGWKLYRTLLEFTQKVHEERGYQEIVGPQLNSRSLWVTSGHWEHYQENMFLVDANAEGDNNEDNIYALKPMNCPNALITYGRKSRSYRDFPLRYMETSIIHRREPSGALHGLLRVQCFRQDDSHNFITEGQIHEEINHMLDICDYLYNVFGLKYRPTLSTRPEEGYLGTIEQWDNAEAELKKVLTARFGDGFDINEGDGAFYGPKIDIMIEDVLGREWQCCTIQLDFQLCGKFNLKYADGEGGLKTPVLVHRALFGSLERFIGILIEHFAGYFPFWLSPLQVGIVPIADVHESYADEVAAALKSLGIRVHVDKGDGTMGNKIKNYRNELVPYIIILGDKEVQDRRVSLRARTGKQVNDIALSAFTDACIKMAAEHTIELFEEF